MKNSITFLIGFAFFKMEEWCNAIADVVTQLKEKRHFHEVPEQKK